MTRQAANQELVRRLAALVAAHPDLRFSQLLRNFRFVDEAAEGGWCNEFFLESEVLLDRVRSPDDSTST